MRASEQEERGTERASERRRENERGGSDDGPFRPRCRFFSSRSRPPPLPSCPSLSLFRCSHSESSAAAPPCSPPPQKKKHKKPVSSHFPLPIKTHTLKKNSRADAFADAEKKAAATEGAGAGGAAPTSAKDYVHIRVQQRNGRKSLTTIQGLDKSFDYKKIIKAFKKEFCCNGTVVDDAELGAIIQLQGDQRVSASAFLVDNKIVKKAALKIHGF